MEHGGLNYMADSHLAFLRKLMDSTLLTDFDKVWR